jgi:hypothetical protein
MTTVAAAFKHAAINHHKAAVPPFAAAMHSLWLRCFPYQFHDEAI